MTVIERDIRRWHDPEKGTFLYVAVMYDQDIAIGSIGMERKDNRSSSLAHLSVDAQYRGLGIATLLTKLIMDKSKECGYSKINLTTSTVQIAAVKLYESSGFQFEGFTDFIPFGRLHGLKQIKFVYNL